MFTGVNTNGIMKLFSSGSFDGGPLRAKQGGIEYFFSSVVPAGRFDSATVVSKIPRACAYANLAGQKDSMTMGAFMHGQMQPATASFSQVLLAAGSLVC